MLIQNNRVIPIPLEYIQSSKPLLWIVKIHETCKDGGIENLLNVLNYQERHIKILYYIVYQKQIWQNNYTYTHRHLQNLSNCCLPFRSWLLSSSCSSSNSIIASATSKRTKRILIRSKWVPEVEFPVSTSLITVLLRPRAISTLKDILQYVTPQ